MDGQTISDKQLLWERKLLDFSLRNNLLNTKIGRKAIPFVSFDIEKLEDFLQQGVDYRIVPFFDTKKEPLNKELYDSVVQCGEYKQQVINLSGKKQLVSYLTEKELADNLKYIYRTAKTAFEENGTNSLFLALGFVEWIEDVKNDVHRFAPVLLLPVEIIRKNILNDYSIRLSDGEAVLNITLKEFLKQQYAVDLSELNILPSDEKGIDVNRVFDCIESAISPFKGWKLRKETVLGLFSFNKFVMWNDIHSNSQAFRQNKIIDSLIQGKLQFNDIAKDDSVRENDKNIEPDAVAVPLDVDSSQLDAVIQSAKDKSFILYGPPGTGKSQTITNIIANALYHNKRVLFVAEKMAALEVVQKRLEKIGLGSFCLELHSNKATKKHFLEQMRKALDISKIRSAEDYKKTSESIFRKRKDMINYAEAVHEKDEYGFSLFDCMVGAESTGRDIELSAGNVETKLLSVEYNDYKIPDVIKIKKDDIELWKNEISEIQIINEINSGIHTNNLRKLDPLATSEEKITELKALLNDYICLQDEIQMLDCFDKIRKYINIGNSEDDKTRILADKLAEFEINYNKIADKTAIIRFFAKKKYKKDFDKYAESSKDALEELKTLFRTWYDNFDGIDNWIIWCNKKNEYKDSQFYKVLYDVETKGYQPEMAISCFIKAIYVQKAEIKIKECPELRVFNSRLIADMTVKYRKDTKYFQELTKQELYHKLSQNIPSQTMEAVASSEMGILKRNILNGGRGNSIRSIIDKIPTLLPKLTPCMLMSPISVAQYLDINAEPFDLVIFDEASQMPTSEAVGAIARGKNLIVVGDPKQMPPTSFFSVSQTDDSEADIDDMESILDDCISLSMQEYYLSWHYRSKHESLIAFSNYEYYDSRLYTFPSVDDKISKVSLREINGVYDKGRTRSNIQEAEAIVEEVIRRLKDANLCKNSIGIISFSKVQQNLIEDTLENELSAYPELQDLAYNSPEPVFVKNLENVQGDERDVILFSIGYGADKEGKVSMNFGPLNNIGGERRLNVALSRARCEMIVFSTLKPEQIDLNRTQSKGVAGLKAFLEFAKTSRMPSFKQENTMSERMMMAKQIADKLNAEGCQTTLCVGTSKFKVDIAIADKNNTNTYILGILCDFDNYYAIHTVRDREVVLPNVLKSLNWNVMRVWSVDWYLHKDDVIKSILHKLESLYKDNGNISDNEAVNTEYKFSLPENTDEKSGNKNIEEKVQFDDNTLKRNISDIPQSEIKKAITYVLQQQIALPKEDLKRAVCKSLGFQRIGQNIASAIENQITIMQNEGLIDCSEDSKSVRLK